MNRTVSLSWLLPVLWINAAARGETPVPPVLLPDGREFLSWEQPLRFSRTYWVDRGHADAADDNPGTEDRPLETVQAAADLAQPGERVLIKSGIYRETVRLPRGGTGPEAMISYEAAPGHQPVLRGSDAVAPDRWQPARLWALTEEKKKARVWWCDLEWKTNGEGTPFARFNVSKRRKPVWGFVSDRNHMRRGLVYQDGRRLKQVMSFAGLLKEAGTYWVEDPVDAFLTASNRAEGVKCAVQGKLRLYLRPAEDRDPREALIETTRTGCIFAAAEYFTGYIRVKSLAFEHASPGFPRSQLGAVSTMRGHHWIVEDCTIRESNALGLDIGMQSGNAWREKEGRCGWHIVRRNRIEHCGVGGLAGSHGAGGGHGSLPDCLIEDNTFAGIGWQGCETIMECAAIKLHGVRDSVLRRNLLLDTRQASGIWFDYPEANSRITRNLIVDTSTIRAAIFMEGSHVTNMVDRNVIIGVKIERDPAAYPREYGGFGIKSDHTDRFIVAHNLIVNCQSKGMELGYGDRQRGVRGRSPTARGMRVIGNIVLNCADAVEISNPHNRVDYNLYGGIRNRGGWDMVEPYHWLDFATWREATGFDLHSKLVKPGRIDFDRDKLLLTLPLPLSITNVPPIPALARDYHGRPWPEGLRRCGPFAAELPAGTCIDPRRPQ